MIFEGDVLEENAGSYAGRRGQIVPTHRIVCRGSGPSAHLRTYVEYELLGDEVKLFGTLKDRRVRIVVKRLGGVFKDAARLEGLLTVVDKPNKL